MTAGDKSTVMASLKEGLHKANALNALLEEELALLKAGDLDSFEALQAKKSETLEALSTLIPLLTSDVSLTEA